MVAGFGILIIFLFVLVVLLLVSGVIVAIFILISRKTVQDKLFGEVKHRHGQWKTSKNIDIYKNVEIKIFSKYASEVPQEARKLYRQLEKHFELYKQNLVPALLEDYNIYRQAVQEHSFPGEEECLIDLSDERNILNYFQLVSIALPERADTLFLTLNVDWDIEHSRDAVFKDFSLTQFGYDVGVMIY